SAVTKASYVALDITDKDAVEKVITEVNPDAVIHCAAWTAVDMAEDDDKVSKVRAINAVALRALQMFARIWTAR
ncbi:MAG: sugar nucleotide-binding protein, partial [Clostridium sp.]